MIWLLSPRLPADAWIHEVEPTETTCLLISKHSLLSSLVYLM
jgi:hypothetical protein